MSISELKLIIVIITTKILLYIWELIVKYSFPTFAEGAQPSKKGKFVSNQCLFQLRVFIIKGVTGPQYVCVTFQWLKNKG